MLLIAEGKGVENVPPQQLLKRPVQEPANKMVTKRRKEVKTNKATKKLLQTVA